MPETHTFDPVDHLTNSELEKEIVFARAALVADDPLTVAWFTHLCDEWDRRNPTVEGTHRG